MKIKLKKLYDEVSDYMVCLYIALNTYQYLYFNDELYKNLFQIAWIVSMLIGICRVRKNKLRFITLVWSCIIGVLVYFIV